jgi:hypothetical protein
LHPVCSRPFTFVKRATHDHLTVARFPKCWDEKGFKVQNWPAYEARAASVLQPDIADRGQYAGSLADMQPWLAGSLHRRDLMLRTAFKLQRRTEGLMA